MKEKTSSKMLKKAFASAVSVMLMLGCIFGSAVNVKAQTEGTISADMSEDEIQSVIDASDAVHVASGDYSDKILCFNGKNVTIGEDASSVTEVSRLQFTDSEVSVAGAVNVNQASPVVIPSQESALLLQNSSVSGATGGDSILAYGINSGSVGPSAFLIEVCGSSVVLNDLTLTACGSNGDRGLLNIASEEFDAENCVISATNNSGWNLWGSAGCANLCIGYDNRTPNGSPSRISFTNCVLDFSGSQNPFGNGIEAYQTTNSCVVEFVGGELAVNDNGGNGISSTMSTNGEVKTFRFIDIDVSICRNGTGKKGACIGFANASIELLDLDGVMNTFTVSDNYAMGVGSNNESAYSSITAQNYAIYANNNGFVDPDFNKVSGYGLFLKDGASEFTDCYVETKLNAGNGLCLRADVVFSATSILSCCNDFYKGMQEENDTVQDAGFTVSFISCESVRLGNVILDGMAIKEESRVIANMVRGELETEIDDIFMLEGDEIFNRDQDLRCHHFYVPVEGSLVDTSDENYGYVRMVCISSNEALSCAEVEYFTPLVQVNFDENIAPLEQKTGETYSVNNMPEDQKNLTYKSNPDLTAEPSADGAEFMGWSLDSEGNEMVSEELVLVEPSVTLYANWQEAKSEDESSASTDSGEDNSSSASESSSRPQESSASGNEQSSEESSKPNTAALPEAQSSNVIATAAVPKTGESTPVAVLSTVMTVSALLMIALWKRKHSLRNEA